MVTVKELNRKIITKQNKLGLDSAKEEDLIIISILLWKEVYTLKNRYHLKINVKEVKFFKDFITLIKKLIKNHEQETQYEITILAYAIKLVQTSLNNLSSSEKEFYLELLDDTLIWFNKNVGVLIKDQVLNNREDIGTIKQVFTNKMVELENTSKLTKIMLDK